MGSGKGLFSDGTNPLPKTNDGFYLMGFLWHLPDSYLAVNAQATVLYNELENDILKLLAHSPADNGPVRLA